MHNEFTRRQQVTRHSLDSIAAINDAGAATDTASQTKYAAMGAIVDCLPIGVFLVGHGCEVHETNECAREILALDDGIQIQRRVLKAASHSETQRLNQLVEMALKYQTAAECPGENVIVLSRPSGLLKFSALVSSLTANQNVSREPLAVIFLSDMSRPIEISPRRLEKLYNFTFSEALLASLLAQGLNLKDAAVSLGVSLNTVRTHLRSIFEKTGCVRQAEVVRTILSGVSILKSKR